MKRNAIARIIAYSLLIVVLTGILLSGLGVGTFQFNTVSGEPITNELSVDPSAVRSLDIDWAAGSILIQTATDDSKNILIYEVGAEKESQKAVWRIDDKTLHLSYSKSNVNIGGISMPEKNLIIVIPQGWSCETLEIDGAALDVHVEHLYADELDLDTADMDFYYSGVFNTLECDGADCQMDITCLFSPDEISIDGADCQLDLSLPSNSGFAVETNGLACTFSSNVPHTGENGEYFYSDRRCHIDVDGMDCHVNINVEAA